MRKLIPTIAFIIALTLHFLPSFAQISEAVITFDYEMKADDPGIQQQLAPLAGSSMRMSFKDQYFRTDTDMAMNITSVIYNGKKQNGLTLMDMMGVKWAIPLTREDMALEQQARKLNAQNEAILTNEHKIIAGYNCRKIIVRKGNEESILYVTDEIKPANNQNEYQFTNVDGFPLMMQSKVIEGDAVITITIKAKDIQTKVKDKRIFSTAIPKDYVKKTLADLSVIDFGG